MGDLAAPNTITIVRHGPTPWSAAGRHTGRTDIPLNQDGVAAAKALASRLKDASFSLVLCSPLERARATCELAGFGEVAAIDADLQEWDYGDYEGMATVDIRKLHPGWRLFVDGVPNGESLAEVASRADRLLARIAGAQPTSVLLFGHGHALRVLTARWMELDAAVGEHLALDPATISVLGREREVPVIKLWNDGT